VTNTPEPDLIDRIAAALPKAVRADYYREVSHCRSLPENDEMLRILRVMLFLTLLMETVPNRMLGERERLDSLLRSHFPQLRAMLDSVLKYHAVLDQRLKCLPQRVAAGLNPEAIAACINESLRQQFAKSTIPESARALTQAAFEIKTAATNFSQDASQLGNAYRGAAEEARSAITRMESAITAAAESARRATKDMAVTFHHYSQWAEYALFALFILAGAAFGILIYSRLEPPERVVPKDIPVVVQPAPQVTHPEVRPKSKP
jgi:hypothetical protein